ncbi:MAG: hypothetical protein AAFR47_23200, partial [Pseudomonadota bacterium]
MAKAAATTVSLGTAQFDASDGTLTLADGSTATLRKKSREVLCLLLRHRGETVEKSTFFEEL